MNAENSHPFAPADDSPSPLHVDAMSLGLTQLALGGALRVILTLLGASAHSASAAGTFAGAYLFVLNLSPEGRQQLTPQRQLHLALAATAVQTAAGALWVSASLTLSGTWSPATDIVSSLGALALVLIMLMVTALHVGGTIFSLRMALKRF